MITITLPLEKFITIILTSLDCLPYKTRPGGSAVQTLGVRAELAVKTAQIPGIYLPQFEDGQTISVNSSPIAWAAKQ